MPAITPVPLVVKDCLVQFTDSYEKAVSQVEFAPSSSQIQFTAVSPGAVYTDMTPATWVLNLTFVQDWDSLTSLSKFLFDNEGETLAITVEPKTGGATITANVTVTPGSIGGTVGTYATSTVALGVVGKPTFGVLLADDTETDTAYGYVA